MPISSKKISGVTMIELVVYIAIVGIALVGVMVVYLNTTRYSADPMVRIRAVQLGQSLLEEILLKGYDDNTPNGGGCVQFAANSRCASGPNAQSTSAASLQAEAGENRATFDDVDDYHNLAYIGTNGDADPLCTAAEQNLLNAAGTNIANQYAGFGVCIRVAFAGNEMNNVAPGTGTTVLSNDAKRIDVIVTDHLQSRMVFTAYRLNF